MELEFHILCDTIFIHKKKKCVHSAHSLRIKSTTTEWNMHVASIQDKFDHPEMAVQLTGSKNPVTKYLSHALSLSHTHTHPQ